MIKVQIINKGHQPLPAFATPQSAGMDLRANIDEAIVLSSYGAATWCQPVFIWLCLQVMKRRSVLAAVWL